MSTLIKFRQQMLLIKLSLDTPHQGSEDQGEDDVSSRISWPCTLVGKGDEVAGRDGEPCGMEQVLNGGR